MICPAPHRGRVPTRRQLLRAMLAAGPGLAATAHAQNTDSPPEPRDGVHLTVAGPEGGELDIWSRTLVPTLGGFLSTTAPLRRSLAGGVDGITGANQFAAQAVPDGSGALLLPGAAMTALLCGDPRAHFQFANWVPVLSSLCSTVIAGRVSADQLVRGQKLRIGISGPNGPEVAALLGLEQLGLQPVAVTGMIDQANLELAFAQHAIDVLMLRGAAIASALATTGARPICVLGSPGANGIFTRDPALPDVPMLAELLGGLPNSRLSLAWHAVATTAQILFILLLPRLTPASAVSQWRRAAAQAAATTELQAMAATRSARLQTTPDAMNTVLAGSQVVSSLREWLGERQGR